MDKNHQSIGDFLDDEGFRRSVIQEEDLGYWDAYLKRNPEKAELYSKARSILLQIKNDTVGWEKERKEAIYKRINESKGKETLNVEKRNNYLLPQLLVFVLLGILIISLLVFPDRILVEADKKSAVADEQWIQRQNPPGQKSRINLGDGSVITLNAASSIKYDREYGKTHRNIYLEGEAYFEVEKDSLPFKVHSGDCITKALGTSFNITAYQDLPFRVQLEEGKVSVDHTLEDEAIVLDPGEEVFLDPSNRLITGKFDISKAFGWKDGNIFFEGTDFLEVVSTLERWYAVEITVENLKRKNLKISAEFRRDNLDNVLNSLGYTFGFKHSIEQKNVTIKFN